MTHDEQRAVKQNQSNNEHTAAKYRAAVKNQHVSEKRAQAEKRSVDF
jgi:hypothetical protein